MGWVVVRLRKQRLPTRRRPRWCPGLQTPVHGDTLDLRRLVMGGNELQLAAKLPAVSDG